MAFLDNSGDIILDAVLTDEGRRRLALGNGSFNISKFALADDEIDYSLYDKTPTSGSGYEDLRILQLPVFEAFTNNLSSVKSKLITYADSTLLHLPVIKLNTKNESATTTDPNGPNGGYYVAVDTATSAKITSLNGQATSAGYRFAAPTATPAEQRIIVDQGIDSSAVGLAYLANGNNQQSMLLERAFLVEVDNRLLSLSPTTPNQNGQMAAARPSFVDDDNVASYFFGFNDASNYFARQSGGLNGTAEPAFEYVDPIVGGRVMVNSMIGPSNTTGLQGSRLVIGLRSQLGLQQSDEMFTTLGSSTSITIGAESPTFKFINTSIRFTGFNTGYRIEIPLKLLKFSA